MDTLTVMVAQARAATWSDPKPFPSSGGRTAGTTVGRANTVSSMCAGSIQNCTDAVYSITGTTGPILISVSASFAATAYAMTTCVPSTTMCVSNMTAMPGNPLSVPAGAYLIVVDSANAGLSGDYTLKLEVQ